MVSYHFRKNLSTSDKLPGSWLNTIMVRHFKVSLDKINMFANKTDNTPFHVIEKQFHPISIEIQNYTFNV